ncbi:hypothetical protein [Pseudomonas sp. nanlin1]|uniref:hypothetical protein n=1 Tax=Pseudomonas sp. nanlin1 TaxID=3040605 RepID=UPI00388E0083
MSSNRIPFGEREGLLLRADEVENGLRCKCICPGCKHPLNAANQGEKIAPYFRHAQSSACETGFREGVRRAAVALIAEQMNLTLPAYQGKARVSCSSGLLLTESIEFGPQLVTADHVSRFVDLGEARAHAVFRVRGHELLIRIKMSARNEFERHRYLHSLHKSCIEIDLHKLTLEQVFDRQAFETFVLRQPGNRSWIRSLRAEQLQARLEANLQARVLELDAQWAAEKAAQAALEMAREAAERALANQRAQELGEHRKCQARRAGLQAGRPSNYGGASVPLLQRQYLIVATRLKAAREWEHRGAECSACFLLSPPKSRFCSYCTSDSPMIDVTIAADVERTIDHQMRSSAKPARSLELMPELLVTPEE